MSMQFRLSILSLWSCCLAASVFSLLAAATSFALDRPEFIRLVPDGALSVFNAGILCTNAYGPEKDRACKPENQKPKVWTARVFEAPSLRAKQLGVLTLTARPGAPLELTFTGAGGRAEMVTPDQSDSDLRYGPFFDFTVADLKGDWIELPKRPFPTPVWIDLKEDWKIHSALDLLKPIATKTVYKMLASDGSSRNVVFLKFKKDQAAFRNETIRDNSCGEAGAAIDRPRKMKTSKLPFKKLYDEDGHLRLKQAYTRGC